MSLSEYHSQVVVILLIGVSFGIIYGKMFPKYIGTATTYIVLGAALIIFGIFGMEQGSFSQVELLTVGTVMIASAIVWVWRKHRNS